MTRSRCPRTRVLSTQKPFSGLWKVTRSTSPARTSRFEESCRRPVAGFTTCRGRGRSAHASPTVPHRPPQQGPPNFTARHRKIPTCRLHAALSSRHAGPDPSSVASPVRQGSCMTAHRNGLARLAYDSVRIGRGCLFGIRNSRIATGSPASSSCSLRQRPIARLVVRASSPRKPSCAIRCVCPSSSRSRPRTRTADASAAAARGAAPQGRARRSNSHSGSRTPARCPASVRFHPWRTTGSFPRGPSPPGAARPRT